MQQLAACGTEVVCRKQLNSAADAAGVIVIITAAALAGIRINPQAILPSIACIVGTDLPYPHRVTGSEQRNRQSGGVRGQGPRRVQISHRQLRSSQISPEGAGCRQGSPWAGFSHMRSSASQVLFSPRGAEHERSQP